ncbi:unnamed protein product [Soboliphyme baturini]|uniref:C2 domain-containing protein n=1 Tax=Soboliphyme baturini TaxID=241478 RepID=A0A183J2K8_9BILA|nr:unnamed protein product [Soboliphyme baturini]
MKCVFVRKRTEKPVKIDVWSSNLVKDTFIGRVLLDCPVTNSMTKVEKQLQDKGKRMEEPEYRLGKLLIHVATFDNPMHF